MAAVDKDHIGTAAFLLKEVSELSSVLITQNSCFFSDFLISKILCREKETVVCVVEQFWVSKEIRVCFGFALLHVAIGKKKNTRVSSSANQKSGVRNKPKLIVTRSPKFSRVSPQLNLGTRLASARCIRFEIWLVY